ncbi:hypothetical protein ACFL38_00730 [Candidatus Omnitrophota bacterium]
MLHITKKEIVILAILIIAVGAFYLGTIRDGHNWGGDFAMYIHHAKNIAEGIDYSDTGFIINPLNIIAPKTFPPIFPFLLSPIYKIFGLNLTAMKVEIIVMFLLSLIAIFVSFKDELRLRYRALLIAFIGFNVYFWSFSNNILSDFPFLFFVYVNLFFIQNYYKSPGSKDPKLIHAFFLGLILYLACGTRSIGITLVPSMMLYEIITRRKISLFTITALATLAALLVIQTIFFYSAGENLTFFSFKPKAIILNLIFHSKIISHLWFNGFNKLITLVLFIITSIFAVIGYVCRVKKNLTIFEIFPLIYAIPVTLWPYLDGPRFLFPLLPLYVFFTFQGIHYFGKMKSLRIEKHIVVAITIAISISYIARYSKADFGPLQVGIARQESIDLFDFVQQSTKPTDICVFAKPRVLSLYAQRKSFIYPKIKKETYFWAYLLDMNATYFIVGKNFSTDYIYAIPFIKKYQRFFTPVYFNKDFAVFKIRKDLLPFKR